MNSKLLQLTRRIQELESIAASVVDLVQREHKNETVQPELNTDGQRWYRGAREILVTQKSSSLQEFDSLYTQIIKDVITSTHLRGAYRVEYGEFLGSFNEARSLLLAVADEIASRELPLRTQLSFAVSADEFERASELVESSNDDEALLRAAGVIGRVALERHLWSVVESHGVAVVKNPPTKKKADTQDLLTSLVKADVLTPIQRSEIDSLFAVGNNCAHPKETVARPDVERLLSRGRELASTIL